VLSPHRYLFSRGGGAITVAWCCVNPSTAEGDVDDASTRKIDGFTRRWFGPARWLLVNKFAGRATDVRDLPKLVDPIGPENDRAISGAFVAADAVVFGWGAIAKLPPGMRSRWVDVYRMAIEAGHAPLCFGACNDGHPRHPLMTPYETPPTIWERPNG
jgi:hypothetical protein